MKSETHSPHKSLADAQARVQAALEHWLPSSATLPATLHEAMRYAALGDGKGVRPALVYASGAALGVTADSLDGPACAVELIHAYSLAHDDLPAMDNDDFRRGKLSCHRACGEAMAILAGDALQSLAFFVLAHDTRMQVSASTRLKMIEALALAAGSRGMAGGQAMDLAPNAAVFTIAELESLHIHKTGALIRASVMLGALSAENVGEERLAKLDHYAKCLGLAFQIRDDILDSESDSVLPGHFASTRTTAGQSAYPALLGLSGAKIRAHELRAEALLSLKEFDDRADALRWLCDFAVERTH